MSNLPRGPLILPSILSADFARLGEDCRAVVAAGAKVLHVDVMDGHFVPNITLGPDLVAALRRSVDVPLDVHLMIERPEQYVGAFRAAGADVITVHAEATHHLHRLVQQIKETGAAAGVSLNPATPLSVLDYVLEDLDLVLIMTVNPGFGGQKPIPAAIGKVRELRARLRTRGITRVPIIEVDGGVKVENFADYHGADWYVSGSGVFNLPGVAEADKRKLDFEALKEGYRKVLGRFDRVVAKDPP